MAKSTKPIEERDPKKVAAGRKGGHKGGRRGGLARAKFQPKHVLSAIGALGGRAKGVACARRRAAEKEERAPAQAALDAEITRHLADAMTATFKTLGEVTPQSVEATRRKAHGERDHDGSFGPEDVSGCARI